jgi:hypothetical protein
MQASLKKRISRNLINIPGWRTSKKIVVIESDDWGTIRMPSKEVYNQLLARGLQPDKDPYLCHDCLESEDDLQALFEVLSSVADQQGRPARITANTVMANPDFKKIKESNFSTYYFEHFTKTYSGYPNHSGVFEAWKAGMTKGVFHPQFHGREHLNVHRWMMALKAGHRLVHTAFENGMISIASKENNMQFDFMEGLDYFNEEERSSKSDVIKEGLKMFEDTFGYQSKSFIANCYIWDSTAEEVLKKNGVLYLQGILNQLVPKNANGVHSFSYKKHYTGQRNRLGQYYLIRNAFFEPSLTENSEEIVNECLHRIKIAFKWNKPAIIGSHRVNYIGTINSSNREQNLILLKELLNRIVANWPDAEFMSSDEVGDLIHT